MVAKSADPSDGRRDKLPFTFVGELSFWSIEIETRRLNAERPVSTHPRSLTVVPANGGNRRVSPVAGRPGEGLLTEPTAATQPWRRLPLFMPHTCRSQYASGPAQLGGDPTLALVRPQAIGPSVVHKFRIAFKNFAP